VEQAESLADESQAAVTKRVIDTARWIDSFFRTETYEEEHDRSSLRLRFDTFLKEGENVDFNVRPSLRLVLPHAERRFQLIISDNSDDEFGLDRPQTFTSQPRPVSAASDTQTASVRYAFLANEVRHLAITGGAQYRDGTPAFYLGPRYRRNFDLDRWLLRFTERLRWFTDEGFESISTFELERPFRDTYFFRSILEGNWFEDTAGYFYQLTFQLFRQLGPTRAIGYEWGNFFVTHPAHELSATTLKVTYRQQIWRPWLFLEISPQVTFPRDRDFETVPGVLFRFEVFFRDNRYW
jgi:hypothetical protein